MEKIFETHAHLDYFAKDNNLNVFERVVEEICLKCGIEKIVIPPISFESNWTISRLISESRCSNNIYQAIGLHPREARNNVCTKRKINEISKLINESEKVVALKTGLDFSSQKMQEVEKRHQIEWLERLVVLAAKNKLSVVLHIREAWDVFLDIWKVIINRLDNYGLMYPKTEIHCFNQVDYTTTEELIKNKVAYLGVGGKIFKDEKLREVVKYIDIKHILLETDSPFLTPDEYEVPEFLTGYFDIKKNINTPGSLILIAKEIASIRHESLEYVISETYKNGCEFFGV